MRLFYRSLLPGTTLASGAMAQEALACRHGALRRRIAELRVPRGRCRQSTAPKGAHLGGDDH
jgi:hypothetical protein